MIRDWLFRNTIGRLPRKPLGTSDADIYLVRYTLFKTRRLSLYLHEFRRSDADLCLHDHPWSFVSLILRGGYWEEVLAPGEPRHYLFEGMGWDDSLTGMAPTVRRWRRPGSILVHRAHTAHRVILREGTHPWTLVLVGPRHRDWGFHTKTGWEPWRPGMVPICEDRTLIPQSYEERKAMRDHDRAEVDQEDEPTIVCLCGSTRFREAFEAANRAETLAGRIVLSVGMFGHQEGLDMDGPVKAGLDRLHLRKIDLADEVLFLNVGGYIGESTRRELEHARSTGKVVRFLEPHV